MLSGFIIAVALVLGGLAVMRFGIFQIRKFKKGETKVTKKISEQIAFIIFFLDFLRVLHSHRKPLHDKMVLNLVLNHVFLFYLLLVV